MRVQKNSKRRDRVLVALRTMTIGNKVYPCGSLLPLDMPEKALKAMIDARPASAKWAVHGDKRYPQARELPPQPPPPPRPTIQIVEDNDVVESWHLTKAAVTRVCDGNSGLAMDLLMASADGR